MEMSTAYLPSFTGTYSPEDNKLRLYSSARLPEDLYKRVSAAGFKYASKQEVFVAPAWTPGREDILLQLCEEIGDEDSTLVDRAEARADRFEGYSEKRGIEAERAHQAVDAIAARFEAGQPILIGHHSARRALKDKERIENGMRKAINLWDTSKYWEERAAGALANAKYKDLPAVRARRIKTLESDLRKKERTQEESTANLARWNVEGLTLEAATGIACYDHLHRSFSLAEFPRPSNVSQYEGSISLWSALTDGIVTAEQAAAMAVKHHCSIIKWAQRWISHLKNRLAYERAMLAEKGGIVSDRIGPQVGGAVSCWAAPRGGWAWIKKVNKVSITLEDNWGNGGKNFTRTIPFDKLLHIMTPQQVSDARACGALVETKDKTGFYLQQPNPPADADAQAPDHVDAAPAAEPIPDPGHKFEVLKSVLKTGIQTVSAPQLFPTPPDLAARMVDLADLQAGQSVLEPSAGTGNILNAIADTINTDTLDIHAVEINCTIADALAKRHPAYSVSCCDFLKYSTPDGIRFQRILMNPPFSDAQDIRHIFAAMTLLAPGGKLVAVCAAGSRQTAALKPLVDSHGGTWEVLPSGTFAESGTGVTSILLSFSV